jgi:hypothetical protein
MLRCLLRPKLLIGAIGHCLEPGRPRVTRKKYCEALEVILVAVSIGSTNTALTPRLRRRSMTGSLVLGLDS